LASGEGGLEGLAEAWGLEEATPDGLASGLGLPLGVELLAGVAVLQAVRQRTSKSGESWRICKYLLELGGMDSFYLNNQR